MKKNPFVDEKGEPQKGKEKEHNEWIEAQANIKKRYIENLEAHIKSCKESANYSISRFDVLIISLSTGALGFSISFIKDVSPKTVYNNLYLLKISWVLFSASLILNLLSQVTSYYANKYEIKISKSIIREEKGNNNLLNREKVEKWKCILDTWTMYLNGVSLLGFILGIIFLIIFTCNNY